MTKQKILIIEDETAIALNIQDVLEMKGYDKCGIGIYTEETVNM